MNRSTRSAGILAMVGILLAGSGCLTQSVEGLVVSHSPESVETGTVKLRVASDQPAQLSLTHQSFWPGGGGGAGRYGTEFTREVSISERAAVFWGARFFETDAPHGEWNISDAQPITAATHLGGSPSLVLSVSPSQPAFGEPVHVRVDVNTTQAHRAAAAFKFFGSTGGAGGGDILLRWNETGGFFEGVLDLRHHVDGRGMSKGPPREAGSVLIVVAAARYIEDDVVELTELRIPI